MKRKPKTSKISSSSTEQLYKQSDFYRRFSRDLLDHRYAQEFTLNENLRYDDDSEEERYEIAR